MIRGSLYKNKKCVVLEGPGYSVTILPEPGAKIASIRSPRREYLLQRPNENYLEQPFDGVYVDGECSGFDDMFPAIDAGHYDRFPWNGVRIADHGEVWSLPWEMKERDGTLTFSVHGVRFPYRLTKTIGFEPSGALKIRYRLENLSSFDFSFVWAGHLMADTVPGTVVEVPEGLHKAVCTIGKSGRVGSYGDEFEWPIKHQEDGTTERLDVMRPADVADVAKFYFKDRLREGRCALRYPDGSVFELRFPVETVPYLGVMINEKGWDDLYHAILEPCTAAFDRYDLAEARGMGSVLKANSVYEWFLEIDIKE